MAVVAPVIVHRKFPWTDNTREPAVTFRLMRESDLDAIVALAKNQPDVDRAFLRTDITDPSVVREWIRNIQQGRTITVLPETGGNIVGYGSLHHNEVLWTSHMGEIRVLVDHRFRGNGIARRLVAELFHIAREMKLDRVFCQLPANQLHVRKMFRDLNFVGEAILRNWLVTNDGQFHDLMIMTHTVGDFGSESYF